MNLWIRTQNRENTVKIINGYGLKYNDKKTIIANYQPDFTDKYDGYYDVLGTYETKERALEVLNEIELALGCKRTVFNNTIVFVNVLENVNSMVYEMPKE